MTYDFQKANIRDNNATGDTSGTVGALSNLSVSGNRSLDQTTGTIQYQNNSVGNYGGRFTNVTNEDWSEGVFVGHVGHNSPYRTFPGGFGRWRFYSGGSTTEYAQWDTFSIATIGDSPNTLAHVIDLTSAPSSQVGAFDPTNVTRYSYEESRLAGSGSTNLVYRSFDTFLSNVAGNAGALTIYDATSLEDVVRQLRNDNFPNGLGGPTGVGKVTEAVENSGTTLTWSAPVVFGKAGSVADIDGSNFTHQIGKDWTLTHVTGTGVLWVNGWDTSIAGNVLDMTSAAVNMLTPSDWTVFDVDSANVAIDITGMTMTNAGTIRFGTSVSGTPGQMAVAAGHKLSTPNSIDNWSVAGTLEYESGPGPIDGLTATRLVLTQSGSYSITSSNITEVENASGGPITIIIPAAIGTAIETSGTITQVAPGSTFTLTADPADAWAVFDDAGTLVASGTDSTTYTNATSVDAGTWKMVVHRLGHQAAIYSWIADDASADSATYSPLEITRPEGGSAYMATSPSGFNAFVNGDGRVQVDIPNRTANAQELLDAQQDFLHTNDGLQFVHDSGQVQAPTFGVLNGVTYWLNIEGFVYDSVAGITPESAVAGVLISSALHANVELGNGATSFLASALSADDIADAVWGDILDEATYVSGTKGYEQIQTLKAAKLAAALSA